MFTKAEKSKAKLRLAIYGISGSGKTYTALSMATGMSDKIALIDTERLSASKYADRFDFDTADLGSPTIDNYIKFIQGAGQAGYEVLIIDSMTHGWKELLEMIDKIAKTKFKGNSWAAWSEGTPKQNKFIDTLMRFDGHIIATMRSKTEYTVAQDKNGKTKPMRVGLAPEQGKGIEYEFDMLIEMSPEHDGLVLKDRTGKYQDKVIEKPGPEFGRELIDWLNDGKKVKSKKERIKEWLYAESDGDPETTKKIVNKLTAGMYETVDEIIDIRHFERFFDKCQERITKFEREVA